MESLPCCLKLINRMMLTPESVVAANYTALQTFVVFHAQGAGPALAGTCRAYHRRKPDVLAVRELSTMQDDPQQLHLLEFSGSLPQT
jgi:hypothetical protein